MSERPLKLFGANCIYSIYIYIYIYICSYLCRKTILGLSRGGAGEESEETSKSENETPLVAAGPLGRKPGGLPRQRE